MKRRKWIGTALLLGLCVLLLSPWATNPASVVAPSQEAGPTPAPPATASADASAAGSEGGEPAGTPVKLKVAVAMSAGELAELQALEPGGPAEVEVEWLRTEPQPGRPDAEAAALLALQADVMLLPNEAIVRHAVTGRLLPVDAALAGDAESQQFQAILPALKWNGYLWGVPFDMDPYVVVVNVDALSQLPAGGAPAGAWGWMDWQALPERIRQAAQPLAWLAIDDGDAAAWLTWLGTATGDRADRLLLGDGAELWSSPLLGQAIALAAAEGSGIVREADPRKRWELLRSGRVAAAVLPYSLATAELDALPPAEAQALKADRSVWQTAFVWPNGRSFALSADTRDPDAARQWIAGMTAPAAQQQHYRSARKLPVLRSLYAPGSGLPGLGATPDTAFPHQPPLSADPRLPERLRQLADLWRLTADGELAAEAWAQRWPGLSAEP